MIQRIQSIFLLCTAIVAGLMFSIPAASIVAPDNLVYEFYTSKVMQIGGNPEFITWNWMSLALNALIVFLALITIFIHKKKTKSVKPTLFLQLRLSIVNIVLQLGLLVQIWVQVHQVAKEISAEWAVELGLIFPLIGIIFTWLAIRYMIKDIAVLKSFDRIR